MENIHADSELSSQIVTLLGRELKSAQNEIKVLLEEIKALREEAEVFRGHKCLQSPAKNEIKQVTILGYNNSDNTKEEAVVNKSMRQFIASFPSVKDTAPKSAHSTPICRINVDLREYLAVDKQLSASSSNFLYLPTLRWYSSGYGNHLHSAGFLPTIYFDQTRQQFIEESPFRLYYGNVIEIFYSLKEHICYAGSYKCHDLRIMNASGVVVPSDISLTAITNLVFSQAKTKSQRSQYKAIKQLYVQGILKVEAIGLQYVGFNNALFELLERRFNPKNPPQMKRKAACVEDQPPLSNKKPRIIKFET